MAMPNHFRFAVVNPHIGSSRLTGTYASVMESIIRRIMAWEILHGKGVCPPFGHFEIILYEGRNSGLDELSNPRRCVRLRFSYPNLYFEAFKTNHVWHRFSNMFPQIAPDHAPGHRYEVRPLPFEAGYHRRGLNASWEVLRFGRTTIWDIYKVLRDYPNNPGGLQELQVMLTKTSAVFPEALRFPQLRKALMYQMKFMEGADINRFSGYFNQWATLCEAIRRGEDAFRPICGANTFQELLALVGVLLHQG